MATIDNIITRAEGIRDETTIGANTATRVGSVMVDTADHVKQIETDTYPLLHKEVLKPSTFDTASSNSYPGTTYRFPCDTSKSNIAYRNKTITDIYINIYNGGTLSVVIGSNITVGSTTPTTTLVQQFSVVAGVNKLHLTTPIQITSSSDFVGFVGAGSQNGTIKYSSSGDTNQKYITGGEVKSSTNSMSVYFVIDTALDERVTALETDIVTLNSSVSVIPTIQSDLSDQQTEINNIKDEVYEQSYNFTNIADVNDLDTSCWYSLGGSSVSVSTNMTYGFRGYKKAVTKGDVYRIKTMGGTSARSWAVADSAGHILDVATSSEKDCIGNPKILFITQNDAAFIYCNCDSSNYNDFQVDSVAVTYIPKLDNLGFDWHLPARGVMLIGASFAYSANTWFEQGCERFGLTAINRAHSGESIRDDALRAINGTLFTDIESFDIFVMMHCHNFNVDALDPSYVAYTAADYEADTDFVSKMGNSSGYNDAGYSAAFDYVIKKYQTLCYAQRTDPTSSWYNTKSGKPCVIVMCSHWHDARQKYCQSSKSLAEKWGMHYCDFASNIGFSCQKNDAATGAQPSLLYTSNINPTETLTLIIDGQTVSGVTVGWHPARGRGEYIQQDMARIFADSLREAMW